MWKILNLPLPVVVALKTYILICFFILTLKIPVSLADKENNDSEKLPLIYILGNNKENINISNWIMFYTYVAVKRNQLNACIPGADITRCKVLPPSTIGIQHVMHKQTTKSCIILGNKCKCPNFVPEKTNNIWRA